MVQKGNDIGTLLVEIYSLEDKLGNIGELKRLKKAILHGNTNINVEAALEEIKRLADPILGVKERQEEFAERLQVSSEELPELLKETTLIHNGQIEVDLEEWKPQLQDWQAHCKGKPFVKNLQRVISTRKVDDNNMRVIKAISSAYTHLAIEAEQNPECVPFFEKVGDSILKCSSIVHSRQTNLYPLVITFLSQLFDEEGGI